MNNKQKFLALILCLGSFNTMSYPQFKPLEPKQTSIAPETESEQTAANVAFQNSPEETGYVTVRIINNTGQALTVIVFFRKQSGGLGS